MEPQQPKKGGAIKCSDPYGMKGCISSPAHEHRTAEVLAEGKRNLEQVLRKEARDSNHNLMDNYRDKDYNSFPYFLFFTCACLCACTYHFSLFSPFQFYFTYRMLNVNFIVQSLGNGFAVGLGLNMSND